jgi:hypothetical protein
MPAPVFASPQVAQAQVAGLLVGGFSHFLEFSAGFIYF